MKKLFVANRSEIAVRILRSATELGLRTVAIYAHEDRFCVHRFKADEAYLVGRGKGPVAAYLDSEGIIALAKERKVELLHPGYGFLAENAAFARACQAEGITFVGPRGDILEQMGDKIASRRIAQKAGIPVLPGTESPIEDPKQARRIARQIGIPLIVKAAMGGGGRGMRVVRHEKELNARLEEARSEAQHAFGTSSVFIERYIERAKHVEVQILGDQKGNVVHLHERDCSIQRRYQKIVELAPAVGIQPKVIAQLHEAALTLGRSIGYDNAGTVEFLLDLDTNEWFFIEMNPRIQVEHTVTEAITGIDIVRSQILIAQGETLHGKKVDLPPQAKIPRNGFAVQCRVTTEDPEKAFIPDYGKIVNYRSAAGFGIRLDGAMGDTGAVITPFYDSLLVKITAMANTFPIALQRMDRALREMRIRGVKTNIPFLENIIHHPTFRSGHATTRLIDTTPSLFQFKRRRDRATRLLNFLGDVIVNGNPQVKGHRLPSNLLPIIAPTTARSEPIPAGTRDLLKRKGPRQFAQWITQQKRLLITDTTLRDAHQSLLAARLRTYDMLVCADTIARHLPNLLSLEMWGGATFDTCLRFLHENPFTRLRQLREKIPNICFQMLLRGANGVGYSNYPDAIIRRFIQHSATAGIDIFRVFDSLNYLPNLKVAIDTILNHTEAVCEVAICYTGDIIDSKRDKYTLDYYVKLAKTLEQRGAHILAIKDMAGLCHPFAAKKLIKALKNEIGIPIHFHTHDSSGIASAAVLQASEAGVDIVDLAISSLSGLTSQPNLNSIVYTLQNTPRATGLDLDALNQLSIYWEAVRQYYAPFDSSPKFGSAEVYAHEMPGGQYTNLREQAISLKLGNRWPEIVRYYREVNALLGDIVKVTPSSKCVGDLAIFLLNRGIEPKDLVNLKAGTSFPASVVDMLSGGLGQPLGGWPKKIQKVLLGNVKPRSGRPGSWVSKRNLSTERQTLEARLGRNIDDDEFFCYLMYPEVFGQWIQFIQKFSRVHVIPTRAFFYGLNPGEQIQVDIEEGKTLYIKLIHIGEPNEEGSRSLTFELNGRPREAVILDRSIKQPLKKSREKADPADPKQSGAPIAGVVAHIAVSVGQKVKEGDKLATVEAMKMQTTLYAQSDGVVETIALSPGESVDSKDLILRLR